MNDVDRWIYFDGPEPERIRPLLDALRDLPPATAQDKERLARRFFEKLDAMLGRREEPPGAEEDREGDAESAPLARPDASSPHEHDVPEPPVARAPAGPADTANPARPEPQVVADTWEVPERCTPPIPRLKLEQYASFRAELSLRPWLSAEILPRYYVINEEARRALDDHWQRYLAEQPEARAAFEKALAECIDRLRAQPT